MNIRFFTRHDMKGWRKLAWWPVAVIQGKYIHCEVEVGGVVVNADNWSGVGIKAPIDMTPSSVMYVEHDDQKYHDAVQSVLDQKYSWSGFCRLLFPRWGRDPKGMICSELVAFLISRSVTNLKYSWVFVAVPPYRWTPDGLHQALSNLGVEA